MDSLSAGNYIMNLKEIIDKFGTLAICEERCITYEYGELVFLREEIEEWNKIFIEVLGPAIKPSGKKPSREHLQITQKYGGLWHNQTLFKKEFDDAEILAMFWPWQDDVHVTLKMICLKKPEIS